MGKIVVRLLVIGLVWLASHLLPACSSRTPTAIVPTPLPSKIALIIPTSGVIPTLKVSFTATPSLPPSPSPFLTSTPTPTASQTPAPVNTNTPSITLRPTQIPLTLLTIITIENARQIQPIAQYTQNLPVKLLSFSPDRRTLAVGCADESQEALVNLWDLETGKLTSSLKVGSRFLEDASFSPDGKSLALATLDTVIVLVDIQTGEILPFPDDSEDALVKSVAFDPLGKVIAYGYARGGMMHLWDITTHALLFQTRVDPHDVNSLAFTPDGQKLITGGWDSLVRIWNANTGQQILEFHVTGELKTEGGKTYVEAYTLRKIMASSNSEMILFGYGANSIIQVRDINTGQLIRQLTESNEITSIALSSDQQILIIGQCIEPGDESNQWACKHTKVTLLNANTFMPLEGLEDLGSSVAVDPQGKLIAIGNNAGEVRLFGVTYP